MPFEKVEPSETCVIEEYRSGKTRVVSLAYAFGQYRIQVWYDRGYVDYPEVILPNF